MLSASEPCPDLGDYPENDIATVSDIESFEDCQRECKKTDGCVFVTYEASTKSCHVKSAKGSRATKAGLQSGPKDCSKWSTSPLKGFKLYLCHLQFQDDVLVL